MATMKFFFRITPPADPLRFLGLLYAAKMAALKQNADTRQILIRADLHRQTFDPKLRKWVKDRLHYTIDLKDAKMIQEKKHLTFHGYITESPDSKTFTNMFLVTEVKPRDNDKDGSPRVEKDEYVNNETGETLNSWDPDLHDLREMDEPPALRDLGFGDLFISVSTKYLADLKTTAEAEKALEKAAKEEMAAREEALKKSHRRPRQQQKEKQTKNKGKRSLGIYEDPFPKVMGNMFVVRKAAPKKQDKNDTTARIEKDLWYSKRGMKWLNNWDIKLTQELREIEEPAALREVELGHDFLAVGTKYFEELKIMCDVQQALDETATVVKGVRKDAQMVWQQGLGKREEK